LMSLETIIFQLFLLYRLW